MTIALLKICRAPLGALAVALLAACGAEADLAQPPGVRGAGPGGKGDRLEAESGNTEVARSQLVRADMSDRFWTPPPGLDARRGGPAARFDLATLSATEKYDVAAYGLDPAPTNDPTYTPFDGANCDEWTADYYALVGPVTRSVNQIAGNWRMINEFDDDQDGVADRDECAPGQDLDGIRPALDHAWVSAALTYRAPRGPIEQGGVRFEVDDQKNLLIADQVFPDARYVGGPCAGQFIEADIATGHLKPDPACAELGPQDLHAAFFRSLAQNARPIGMRLGPVDQARDVVVTRFEVEAARAIAPSEAARLIGAPPEAAPNEPEREAQRDARSYDPQSLEARAALAFLNTAKYERLLEAGLSERLARSVREARWGRRGFTSDDFVFGSLDVASKIPGMTDRSLDRIVDYAVENGYGDYEDWEARWGYWEGAESNPGLVYSRFYYYGYILGSEESTATLNFVNNMPAFFWRQELDLGDEMIEAIFERLDQGYITNLCELATVRGMTRSSFETLVRYAMDENYSQAPVSRVWAAGQISYCVPPEPPSRIVYGIGERSEEARAILALANTAGYEHYTDVVGLDESAALAITQARQRDGGIGSLCELASVAGITEEQVYKLAYAGVGGAWNFRSIEPFWQDEARAASCRWSPHSAPAPAPAPVPAPRAEPVSELALPGRTEHIIHARLSFSYVNADAEESQVSLTYLLFLDADESIVGGHYLQGPELLPSLLWENGGPSRRIASLDRNHLTSWFQ